MTFGQIFKIKRSELVSCCNLVWMAMVFFWMTGGEGCPYDLDLKFGGPIVFDSRSGVSSLAQIRGFLWSSFGGSEVERWWKIIDLSNRSFMDVAQLWWGGLGAFRWVFVLGWVATLDDFSFSGRFRESVCFRRWCLFMARCWV
jgi:hypothetical protein